MAKKILDDVDHKTPIRGSGGKKKSKSRTPVEAKDSVASNTRASMVDLLGEGVIGGLLDGAKSIYVDKVALMSPDGTYAYNNVYWDFRNGTQDQAVMPKYDTIQTPFNVNVECKQLNPVTVAIQSDDNDYIKMIMEFPGLYSVNSSNGDRNGATVKFKFMMSYITPNGTVVDMHDVIPEGTDKAEITINQKQNSVWYKSFLIKMPKGNRNYQIRCVRLSKDETSSYIQNKSIVNSYIEILNTPFNYPNSAVVGITVNAEDFGNQMPDRAYMVGGTYIRVPSNYDDATNTYNGYWDGTFQILVSENPAWILFDLITNERYGLGAFVKDYMFNLGSLYQVGVYCDGMVSDGKGGKEKRFTLNTVIAGRSGAYDLISDIVSVFRGMIFWSGGMVNVIQDKPKDATFLINNSNVVNGEFDYQGSARKDRPSIALVTWNNPDDYFERSIEYVEDPESIARFGSRTIEVTAFGCTSRAQAHRLGLWTLYTARYETDLISFQMTQEAAFLMPGDICKLQDKYRAGEKQSGRIKSATKNSLKLDSAIEIKPNSFVQIAMSNGTFVERDIIETGSTDLITFVKPLESLPVKNAPYLISSPSLRPLTVRVISSEYDSDKNLFNIVVLEYNKSKFEAIDNGAILEKEIVTNIDPTNFKPANMVITEATYLSSPGNLSVKLIVSWNGRSPEYVFSWRRVDNNENIWHTESLLKSQQVEILNVEEHGIYDFQVYGIAASGMHTEPLFGTHKVDGTSTPPKAPSQLTAIGDYRSIILNWANPDSVDLDHIDIYVANVDDFSKASLLISISATTYTHTGLEDNITKYYWLRAVNKRGMNSPLNSTIGTQATTVEVTSYLQGKITESELGKELVAKIEAPPDLTVVNKQIDDLNKQIDDININVDKDIDELNAFVENKIGDLTKLYDEQKNIISQHDGRISANTSSISAIGETVEDLENKFAVTETSISTLKTELNDAKNDIHANSESTSSLKSNVTSLLDTVSTQSKNITSLQSNMSDAKTKIEANTNAVNSLTSQVDKQGKDISAINSSVTRLESQIQDTESELVSNAQALSELNTTVKNQGNAITAHGDAITSVQSKLDSDVSNLFVNPNAHKNGSLYIPNSIIVDVPTSIKGVHLNNVFKFQHRWNNSDVEIPVVGGETYSFTIYTATDDPSVPDISIGFTLLDKNKANSTFLTAIKRVSKSSTNATWKRSTGLVTIPENIAFAKVSIYIDKPNSDTKMYWYGGSISVTNASSFNAFKPILDNTANSISKLDTKIDQQNDKITLQGNSLTSVSASLARRTVFTFKAAGWGGDFKQITGVYDQYGAKVVITSRSYCLVQFKLEDNGMVSIEAASSYDVFANSDNAIIMANKIQQIPTGVYAAIVGNDEPSSNNSGLFDAIESLGGTRESIAKIPYRGAYILLGQKGLAKGSAVELIGSVHDSKYGCIWTKVAAEFINGAMVNLGGATGAIQISGALASAVTTLDAKVEQQGKNITAQSSKITTIQSEVNGNKSIIADTQKTISKLDSTVANINNVLNSKIGNIESTVSQNAQTVADLNGKLSAMWTVKTQVSFNGHTYVSGIGLSTDSTGRSQFLVQADRFALMNTGAGTVTTPFVIDNGTTYINSAMIKKASINSAMISNEIQSDNYVSGRTGWVLRKDGNFEINAAFGGSSRILINNEGMKVYDENGRIRVKVGKLW